MQRRTIRVAIVVLTASGFAIVGAVLIGTLRPSERTIANSVALELPLPDPSSAVQMDGKRARLILIHAPDGQVRAFSIPLVEGRVPRPDGLSWNPFNGFCTDFGIYPDARHLTGSSVIRCVAPREYAEGPPDIEWSLSGQLITRMSRTYELPQVRVRISAQYAQISIWDRS